jgi:hypothetical protein
VITFNANNVINCNGGIVERDPPSILATLGLTPDTPLNDLKAVLFALRDTPEGEPQLRERAIKASRLWGYVEKSANAATVLEALVSVSCTAAAQLLQNL